MSAYGLCVHAAGRLAFTSLFVCLIMHHFQSEPSVVLHAPGHIFQSPVIMCVLYYDL